ncbi:MAG: TRAP transporter small permease subunit [Paracoccaceae bacterium]
MIDGLFWVLKHIVQGYADIAYVLAHLGSIFDFSDKENLLYVVFYGGSSRAFFAFFDIFLAIFVIGLIYRAFLWRTVRVLEGFANGTGRFFAWAGLFMVLQQTMIVFLQRIFRVSDIAISPFGVGFTKQLGWWAEMLKAENALIVCLCCAYTFVQGGHVRVDMFYARISFRAKKVVDMLGSILFIMPAMVLVWMYGWYYMFRHLITPSVSASDELEKLLRKSGIVRWNVETIGVSPSGFDAYFLFKVMMIGFAGMMLVQAAAFFYRSWLEFVEGPESEGKYLDKDALNDEIAAKAAAIH